MDCPREPRKAELGGEVVLQDAEGQDIVRIVIEVRAEAELAAVVRALRAAGCFAG